MQGGAAGDGTVFEIAKTTGGYANTPTTLVSFNATDGANPWGGLVADAAGDLFGTTEGGAANGVGTVFEIAKTGGNYASTPTTLVTFNGTNGGTPIAGLIADAAGDLFGTTWGGGANGDGTTFELTGAVNGLPAITAPTPATIGVGKAASIPGASLTESGNTTGETFTVTVADTNGLLSVTAGAAMVTGNGSKDVTISGSLSAVSTALDTLSDTDGTAGSDTITVNASDSFGNVATQTMTAITVNGLPAITAPTLATIGVGKAASIPGGSLTESGNTTGETFTVTVADTNGLLSVTAGAAMVIGNGSKDVTISGSLSAVSTALGTLSDTDGTAGSDTITVNASDSFGNTATQKSIGVTVTPQPGTPSITAPATATVGVGQAALISGVSITESPTTGGETFTAVLSDTNGVLSANTGAAGGGGGTITPSNGGKTLTISGTLTQVKADLTTLADTDGTTPSDTILVNASDSNGGTATPASIAVTVNGLPAITAPTPATIGVGKAASIPGASLTESGNTTGETFTVTVADTNGLLSVTAGAAMVTGNGSKDVTISGSLSAVSTALGTLSDTDGTAGSDTITVNASDSFGNVATQTMTAITVNGLPAITAPTPATIRVGKAASIPGDSLTESGNTTARCSP